MGVGNRGTPCEDVEGTKRAEIHGDFNRNTDSLCKEMSIGKTDKGVLSLDPLPVYMFIRFSKPRGLGLFCPVVTFTRGGHEESDCVGSVTALVLYPGALLIA